MQYKVDGKDLYIIGNELDEITGTFERVFVSQGMLKKYKEKYPDYVFDANKWEGWHVSKAPYEPDDNSGDDNNEDTRFGIKGTTVEPNQDFYFVLNSTSFNITSDNDCKFFYDLNGSPTVTGVLLMFYNQDKLTTLDLKDLDTSNITSMLLMFLFCSSLTSLNLSSFDTSNVIDMSYMFSYCSSLSTLDVSNFDTSNVTDMRSMFNGCHSLTSLNLSNFDTSNVTNMLYMFHECKALTSLDLSNFDTSDVTDMHTMFCWCSSLKTLDISNFNILHLNVGEQLNDMFTCCYDLTNIRCTQETKEVLSTGNGFKLGLNSNNITWDIINPISTEGIHFKTLYVRNCDYDYMKENNITISNDYLVTTDRYASTRGGYVFDNLLKSLPKDYIASLAIQTADDTPAVEIFDYPFISLYGLEELYLNTLDASNWSTLVEFTSLKCNELVELYLPNNLHASQCHLGVSVSFLSNCPNLTVVSCTRSMKNFIQSKPACPAAMKEGGTGQWIIVEEDIEIKGISGTTVEPNQDFYFILNGTELNVTSDNDCKFFYDLTDVTVSSIQLGNSSTLSSLDLRDLDTSNVTDMSYMFDSCPSLTSLDVSNFDTSNVTNMYNMFDNCYSLNHIKCKQAFKDLCEANRWTISLDNFYNINWEIVD